MHQNAESARQAESWKAARLRMGASLTPTAPRVVLHKPVPPPPKPISMTEGFRKAAKDEDLPLYHGVSPFLKMPKSEATRIVKYTAHEHGLGFKDVMSKCRTAHIVRARFIAIHRVYRAFPHWSLTQLGAFFSLDHTSVMFALGRLKRKPKHIEEIMEEAAAA